MEKKGGDHDQQPTVKQKSKLSNTVAELRGKRAGGPPVGVSAVDQSPSAINLWQLLACLATAG